MSADVVPASRRVRFTRVRHIDSDRLARRLAFLDANGPALARACDGRSDVRVLARELLTIRAELARRTQS